MTNEDDTKTKKLTNLANDFRPVRKKTYQEKKEEIKKLKEQSAPLEKQPQQQNTIQDSFLNSARKERSSVTIYLMSGVKLTGRIKSFDKYSVILEAGSQEQLIFKHAISTVAVGRSHGFSEKPRMVTGPTTTAPAESTDITPASGTEG